MQLNAFLPLLSLSLFLFFWHLHWHLSRRINACLSGSKSHSLPVSLPVRPSVCLPVSHFVAAGWFISRHLQQQHRWQQRKKRPCPRLRRGRETFRADRWNFLTTDLFTFKQFHRPDQSVGVQSRGRDRKCAALQAEIGKHNCRTGQGASLIAETSLSSFLCFVCQCCLAGTED